MSVRSLYRGARLYNSTYETIQRFWLVLLGGLLLCTALYADGEHAHSVHGELAVEPELLERIYAKSLEPPPGEEKELTFSVGGGQTFWQKLVLKNSYFRFPYEKTQNTMPFLSLGVQWQSAWFAQLTAGTYQGVFSVENPKGQSFHDTVDAEFWGGSLGRTLELGHFLGSVWSAHVGLGGYYIGQSGHLDGLSDVFFVPMVLWGLGARFFMPSETESPLGGEWQGVALQFSGINGFGSRHQMRGGQWLGSCNWSL